MREHVRMRAVVVPALAAVLVGLVMSSGSALAASNPVTITQYAPGVLSITPAGAGVVPASSPVGIDSGCPNGYACAYDSTNYKTVNQSWAFNVQYNNFQNLAGGCWALDSGFSFNDCAKSVKDERTSGCNGSKWYYDANYGGHSVKNNAGTGIANLGGDSDQFSSVVVCAY